MNDWRYDRSNRHDVVTIPLVWFAFALSLLVHVGALWFWVPRLHDLSAADAEVGKVSSALAVQREPKSDSRESAPPPRGRALLPAVRRPKATPSAGTGSSPRTSDSTERQLSATILKAPAESSRSSISTTIPPISTTSA